MSKRLELFSEARVRCEELMLSYPENRALISIAKQIEYLIGLESGVHCDRSRLKEIVIGVLTAREIEPLDADVASLFYKVAGEATRV